jgi:hypothetical protein
MFKFNHKNNDICNWCMAAMILFIPLLTMLLTFILASN